MHARSIGLSGILTALAILLGAVESHAQKVAVAPEFQCLYAAGPIKIDGRADDPAWRDAPVLENFICGWAAGGPRAAKTKTQARVLWDENNFYFIAEMEDHDLFADITEHDGSTWLNDVFELFFKPSDEQRNYYEFEVNARNAVFDLYLPSRGSGMLRRWLSADMFHLQTAVQLRGTLDEWRDKDEGWTVEGLIPWSDFKPTGGKPAAGDRWRFTLCRYDYSVEFEDPDLSSIAKLTRPDFHRYEDYPYLKFVGPSAK